MIHAYHGGYTLDASVVAKWFTRGDEPDRGKAIALRARFLEGHLRIVVPDFCLIEVANAIRFAPPAREEDGAAAIDTLFGLHLETAPQSPELLKKANAIAWAYRASIYDALYVALAETRAFPLVTADGELVRKMKGHSIVLALSDLQFD